MIRTYRPPPAGEPRDYLTYAVASPARTHWRAATCAEFECGAYLRGWATILPADDPRCDYIRQASGRRYREERTPDGMTRFEFEAGQTCFGQADHRVPVGRPPLYVVRRGDWRSWTPLRRHSGADAWVDDFRSHQERLAKERE